MNAVVAPSSTVCGVSGARWPLAPATGVTVCTGSGTNVAAIVQSAVIGAVVYVLPARLPPQPVTVSIA